MNEQTSPLLPHTRINPMTRIRVERSLPAPGEILVQTGERVGALQKIARIPGRDGTRVVNVAHLLGLGHHDLSQVMVKKRGDRVEAGEILAARRGVLPFLHKPCRSPIAGRLVTIGYGWVVIEAENSSDQGTTAEAGATDLLAWVTGRVAAITSRRNVTIETIGTHIVAACGLGGEGNGVLQVLAKGPTEMLSADNIGMGSNNAILVGGAGVSMEALDRAREMKVSGIIVGGINSSLHDLMPPLPFPIAATEGYGNLPMSPIVFDMLKKREGHETSVSGYMGETHDATRPSIIIPMIGQQQEDDIESLASDASTEPAKIGHRVRVVRGPLLGQVGEITSLTVTPQPMPSGLSLPGAQITVSDFERPSPQRESIPAPEAASALPLNTKYRSSTIHFVPWLNLERID